jgi:DNA-binding transcriptional regulator LsrR (DeoR family)
MDILTMYNQGWTVSEISDYTGVPAVEVERLVSEHGLV